MPPQAARVRSMVTVRRRAKNFFKDVLPFSISGPWRAHGDSAFSLCRSFSLRRRAPSFRVQHTSLSPLRKNKKTCPCKSLCWDRNMISCGTTRLDALPARPLSAYTLYMPAFDHGEPRSVSHTPRSGFPLALRSPFGLHIPCRNPTACGSLRGKRYGLLTLPQRFGTR